MDVSGYEDDINFATIGPEMNTEQPASANRDEKHLENHVENHVETSKEHEAIEDKSKEVHFEKTVCDYILDNWVLVVALIIFVFLYIYKVV